MSKYEQEILDTVALHGTISVSALAEQLNVTDQTIRRIVKPMVEKGQVEKVHGAIMAAAAQNDPPLAARLVENRQEKAGIAKLVAGMIPLGAVLAIDAGSTSGFIAQALTRHRNLTVVTNSAYIASTLAMIEGNRVFMAGTQLRNHDCAAFDRAAFDVVSQFTADYAIMTASLVHPELGFLVHDQHEVDMAREMATIAERRIMAVDYSKWRDRKADSPLRLPSLRPGDIVVTNEHPGPDYAHLLRDLDLRLPKAATS
ncbi:DeoR/GlpR family DNA-binding transcription regulator [Nioella nitratireducens]|uniref:DeoR/GlpR family DNA-binding transcription regulator n=1 Tax=Nioella nitratireducens TaxID=1287720 RepID=UPI0008FD3DE2|nr:DeoR/GlpR family DNA-binding transcription regulator [Nioella nitratireducens]